MLFYFYDEAFVHDFFEDLAVPRHDLAYDVEVTTGKPVFGVEEQEHIKLGVLELVFTEDPYSNRPPEFHEVVLHFVVKFILLQKYNRKTLVRLGKISSSQDYVSSQHAIKRLRRHHREDDRRNWNQETG